MSRSPQEVLDMAEKRTTYKLQDVGGIGEVKIADEVVTVIAGLAATEVDGVASMGGNITNELVSKLGVKNLSKGVKVTVLEGVVTVDLTLNIEFGKNILEVSKKVQPNPESAQRCDRSYHCCNGNERTGSLRQHQRRPCRK